jgi:hypothetical protein
MVQRRYQRTRSDRFLIERLPDGSATIFDRQTEAVHSLNQTAALIWECCAEPATPADIAEVIERATGIADATAAVTEGLAQLTGAGLISVVAAKGVAADAPADRSRRTALLLVGATSVGFIAPLVVTMTLTEQRAFAQGAGSPTPTATPTPTPSGATPTPTPTDTPTPTTATPTPTPTDTPTPTTATATPTPTDTPTPTPTVTPTDTPTPTPTNTPTPTP